ncbi:replication-relaxation family protein [Allorhizocola rhizosphaerae]|uniref:replication-relaxation family protein n=1 Tax=Allorhizocola rhizosphaerae TaxID=1872709 RepID=UPI000E3CDF32|nr:replication-relaxation family protein [Allorhizocola rhizosphaerae]
MTETRISQAAVEETTERLSLRERAIVADIDRVRVLSADQLQRLHFHELEGTHRDRTRRRALGRLVTANILSTLDRRIGGARAGSKGLVYTLDRLGQRVATLLRNGDPDAEPRPRKPGEVTERFLGHCLAISELYVSIHEERRQSEVPFKFAFYTEPESWWFGPSGIWLKPDAHVVLQTEQVRDRWDVEVDRATESLSTIRGKLKRYLDQATSPDVGVEPLMAKVLVTVPGEVRQASITEAVAQMPAPAEQLFDVVLHERAAAHVIGELGA